MHSKKGTHQRHTTTHGLAIAAWILGVVGFIISFFHLQYLSLIWGIFALGAGIVAVHQIKNDVSLKGNGFAITGIILGALTMLIAFSLIGTDDSGTSQQAQQNTIPQITPPPSNNPGAVVYGKPKTDNVAYQITPPSPYCGDGSCNDDETCASCSRDCGQCKKPTAQEYTTQYFENQEPYYSTYCDKIAPYDLRVREAAATAIRDNPGKYSAAQLFAIYDWVRSNIVYQNVPLGGIPYAARETLVTASGDCKNQAVLIASMVEAIGGTARVVIDPSCEHAYAIVRFGDADEDFSWFTQAVAEHYGANAQVAYFSNKDGTWVIFDPAGGSYPGNTLAECTGKRTVYFVDSCLSCAQQYSDMPYTYGDKCYSECPSGTTHKNGYSCTPCPSGYGSYNNECVTCNDGYILGEDGRCHEPCGNTNKYCIRGTCFNGECITCQNGYALHNDGKCYRN